MEFFFNPDSWISLLDDKENEYPRKQRPVLSDPSDVFGDGTTTNRDEVDGYIDATLDIPEINNEVKDLLQMSHVMRKTVYAICEQQRPRSACASAQSD